MRKKMMGGGMMDRPMYKSGGKTIEMTSGTETQTVTVKGTKAMRADKKPVKAKWY